MASDSSPSAAEQMLKGLPMFFTAVAPKYDHWTGSTTKDLFSLFLTDNNENKLAIDSSSKIHDNAAGPGTASEAIIKLLQSQGTTMLPAIIATDFVPAMIEALDKIKAANGRSWNNVTAEVVDVHALPFADSFFTHSICNFSIFAFADPVKALQETYRTLKPNGTAVVTTWKRFAVGDVMRAAQRIVQGPDCLPLPVVGENFMSEGVLADAIAKAGWDKAKIKTISKALVVKDGAEMDGLMEFMTGPTTAMTRSRFSDEEKAQWPVALQEAVEAEKKAHGGLLMEAWIVIANK